MNILVVLTGGTIGSTVTNGIADTDITASNIIKNIFDKFVDIQFEYISPFTILSENSTCETLSKICSFMLSINFDNYDGIIVTHGSDTLAYTSAILGLTLSFSKIPIVITAADYVLTSPKSNGIDNLNFSIKFILNMSKAGRGGVFTIWKNRGEKPRAHLATRLCEADGMPDSFASWGSLTFSCDPNILPFDIRPNDKTSVLKNRTLSFENNVLLLHSYVGLDFDNVNIKGKKAVLLKLYHSSTACSDFIDFVRRCRRENVDVFVCPVRAGNYVYSSAHSLFKENIISMGNINIVCAYCKLILAYNIPDMKSFFIDEKNVYFETPFD